MGIYQRVTIKCPGCEKSFRRDVYPKTKEVKCPECSLKIERKKNWVGPYEISYRHQGKKVKERVGDNKKLAQIVLGKRLKEIVEGRYIKRKKQSYMSFSQLAETYLKWAGDHLKPESIRRHKTSVNALEPFFGGESVNTITLQDIEGYRKRRLGIDKRLKNTVNNEVSSLCAIFTFGRKMEFTSNHPAQNLTRLKGKQSRDRVYSDKEMGVALDCAPDYFYPVLYGFFRYGMRHQELLSVRRSKYDSLGARQSYINFDEAYFSFWETKNGDERIVPVPDDYLQILRTIPRTLDPIGRDYLFLNSRGQPYRKIQYAWCKTRENALKENVDISDATIHDIRRTFITRAIESGVDIATISELTGVKTLRVLKDHYTRISLEHKKTALSKMEMDRQVDRHGEKQKKEGS